MVLSTDHPLRKAMAEARDAGMEKADVISMVIDVYNAPQVNDAEPAPAAEVIYAELPEGLIDLPSAAAKYQLPISTLRNWVRRGNIKAKGRLRAPAYGGGYVVVDEVAIEDRLSHPTPRGRPRKRADY